VDNGQRILDHTFSHYDESQDRRKVNLLMKLDSVTSHELLQHIYMTWAPKAESVFPAP
jgi:hypothetical protein